MAYERYLAMTAADAAFSGQDPGKPAWMACRFSPAGTALENLPEGLPEGAILMLDDSREPKEEVVAEAVFRLRMACQQLTVRGLLLDFLRRGNPVLAQLAKHLREELNCMVAAPAEYAGDGAVFLPSPPLHKPLSEYLAPWQGRQIVLELAQENQCWRITPEGSTLTGETAGDTDAENRDLHVRWGIRRERDALRVSLRRGLPELEALEAEAARLGVPIGIGLYQDFSAGSDTVSSGFLAETR